MRVLVTGATGLVGCHAVARLVAEGHTVRALVRDEPKLERVLEPFGVDLGRVEAFRGDILERASVDAAVRDCEAALHCAGFYSHEPRLQDELQRTNVVGAENILSRAVEAGLDPVVHVSSMLALLPSPGPIMRAEDPVATPQSIYARTKADAERVARRLQDRGAPLVTVYPASVQGPHDPTVVTGVRTGPHTIANHVRTGRVLVTQGGLAYTDVRDLARVLESVLRPGLGPRRYPFGGPFLTHAEYHALLCEITGRPLKADRIPASVLRLLGWVGDLRQRLFGTWVELDGDAALVFTRSVPLDDTRVRNEFGIEPMSAHDSFRDLLRWMLEAGMLEADHAPRLANPATSPS
ncbi:MAG: hypothetical protein CL908_12080 [Deltaproteobacteria bacterium]|jgi:UDP-glucose 4-epimerase|nr:hypothetical protein [Deltaproteobacteria bacterium]